MRVEKEVEWEKRVKGKEVEEVREKCWKEVKKTKRAVGGAEWMGNAETSRYVERRGLEWQ